MTGSGNSYCPISNLVVSVTLQLRILKVFGS